MSKIQVNEVVNHFDNGAPDFPRGVTVTGAIVTGISSINVTGISTFKSNDDGNGSFFIDIKNSKDANILRVHESDNSSGNNPSVYLYDGSGNNDVKIDTNGKSWFNGGNVGVGTNNPVGKLQVGSAHGSNVIINNSTDGVDINDGKLNIYRATNSANEKAFVFSSNVGGTEIEKVSMTTGGVINISSSSGGIDFSASEGSGATNSLLDDYEEGTWTPTLETGTYTNTYPNSFAYVKIGQLVHCWGRLGQLSDTTSNSHFTITSLPFVVDNNVCTDQHMGSGWGNAIGTQRSLYWFGYNSGQINYTRAYYSVATSASYDTVTHAELSTATIVLFHLNYLTTT